MEEQHNTTEKILSAIEARHVTPRPKWYFAVRNTALWVPGVITTCLGAYTVAGVLYGVIHSHFLENKLYSDRVSQLVSIIIVPVLWVISFGIFSLITTSLLRRTHKGYRHTARQVLSISVASSIIIGILFYFFTAGEITGPSLLYQYPTQAQQEEIWNNPSAGKISGVVAINDDGIVSLTDFTGFDWDIDVRSVPMSEMYRTLPGTAIRVIGIQTGEKTFVACRVLPWEVFPTKPAPLLHSGTARTEQNDCTAVLAHFQQQ